MLTLHLSANWTCVYTEDERAPRAPAQTPEHVTQLDGWGFDTTHSEPVAWLERQFTLHPTDECVQYVLQVAAAPAGTQVIVNDQNLGALSAPSALDVTAFVSLDDNLIAFRVERHRHGAFGDVHLQAVPCE